jgi:chemotaxis protein CheX
MLRLAVSIQVGKGAHSDMKAEYIKPFLESALIVIEQMVQVRPSTGRLSTRDIKFADNHVWIQIGLTGHMNGDIVFGLSESVALRMISAMMGGYVITEIDEMGRSAISELGNMISGNATTMLYNQGVHVDITPPKFMKTHFTSNYGALRALAVPLIMDGIGEMEIQVLIA